MRINNLYKPFNFSIDTNGKIINSMSLPHSKSINQMKGLFLENPNSCQNELVYDFYHDMYLNKDEKLFEKYNIQHDITIIFPGDISGEFFKTSGHYHVNSNLQQFPEIYEVIYGDGAFVLVSNKDCCYNVLITKVKKGDKVVIPPEFGHCAVNVGKEPFIFSDLISRNCVPNYDLVRNKKGLSVYITKNGIIKNKHYENIRMIRSIEYDLNFLNMHNTIYDLFKRNPDNFAFLNNSKKLCYKVIF